MLFIPASAARGIRLAACMGLVVVMLGCAGGKVMPLENQQQFDATIHQSNQPVLVDFFKGGCPTCVALDGTMDKLADEYRGKAIIAKFMLMTPYFVVTSSEIKSRYDISFFPTAILFVNGQPVNRWSLHYKIEDYRHALDAALANPPRGGPSARP